MSIGIKIALLCQISYFFQLLLFFLLCYTECSFFSSLISDPFKCLYFSSRSWRSEGPFKNDFQPEKFQSACILSSPVLHFSDMLVYAIHVSTQIYRSGVPLLVRFQYQSTVTSFVEAALPFKLCLYLKRGRHSQTKDHSIVVATAS